MPEAKHFTFPPTEQSTKQKKWSECILKFVLFWKLCKKTKHA